jgi:hypothetical protein
MFIDREQICSMVLTVGGPVTQTSLGSHIHIMIHMLRY